MNTVFKYITIYIKLIYNCVSSFFTILLSSLYFRLCGMFTAFDGLTLSCSLQSPNHARKNGDFTPNSLKYLRANGSAFFMSSDVNSLTLFFSIERRFLTSSTVILVVSTVLCFSLPFTIVCDLFSDCSLTFLMNCIYYH